MAKVNSGSFCVSRLRPVVVPVFKREIWGAAECQSTCLTNMQETLGSIADSCTGLCLL